MSKKQDEQKTKEQQPAEETKPEPEKTETKEEPAEKKVEQFELTDTEMNSVKEALDGGQHVYA